MRWRLARAQVNHRKWRCTQFLKSELHSIESKASLYYKCQTAYIYTQTHTCVCLAFISFADLQSVEAQTPSGPLQAYRTFPGLHLAEAPTPSDHLQAHQEI